MPLLLCPALKPPNDSSERRRKRRRCCKKSRQQPEQPPGGLKTASKWGDGLCRGGISQGSRLQSHVSDGTSDSEKRLLTHFFPLQKQNILGPLRLLFVSFCSEASPQSSVGWEKLWNWGQCWGESGGPQLSVGKPTHVNYLLLVQQEMLNDNRLGKEKQQNKQIVSHPSCNFLRNIFLFILSLSWSCHLPPTQDRDTITDSDGDEL